ncbi:MAG TPA: DMT family transporter [Candidatus Choladousia intestinigallinarum]|nr:DMT family transporter [Candidatus Choladousia intestinigallinarum]
MGKIKDYIFLHLSVVLFSFTSVFSKTASNQYNEGGFGNPMLYVFVFLMFFDCLVYALCWQKVIKRFDLNIGYANRSVYLLWSQIWAVLFFGENLTPRNIIGLLVVLTGVVIVSLSGEKRKEEA